jgi:hypothetical protein
MKYTHTFLPFIAFLFISIFSSAQVVVVEPNRALWFEYDSIYYDLGYRGVRQFMADRSIDEPGLHHQLQPTWTSIQGRQAASIVCGIGGIGLGLTMAMSGAIRSVNSTGSSSNLYGQRNSSSGDGTGLIIGGSMLFLGGAIAMLTLYPRHSDYMNFVARHNTINKNRKIQWHFLPIAPAMLGPGMRMQF